MGFPIWKTPLVYQHMERQEDERSLVYHAGKPIKQREAETMNWLQQRWEQRAIYRYHFLQSTYISSIWAWFLTFWGKAAEPFLCVSVLYSGAKLMPGVTTPP